MSIVMVGANGHWLTEIHSGGALSIMILDRYPGLINPLTDLLANKKPGFIYFKSAEISFYQRSTLTLSFPLVIAT